MESWPTRPQFCGSVITSSAASALVELPSKPKRPQPTSAIAHVHKRITTIVSPSARPAERRDEALRLDEPDRRVYARRVIREPDHDELLGAELVEREPRGGVEQGAADAAAAKRRRRLDGLEPRDAALGEHAEIADELAVEERAEPRTAPVGDEATVAH